jgi:hypothetical protein
MRSAIRFAAVLLALTFSPVALAQTETTHLTTDTADLSCMGGDQELNCPWGQWLWTPQQVFEYRYDAIVRGDMDAIMCTYSPDAVLVLPGSIIRGRENIRPAFEALMGLFGGIAPTVTSTTVADNIMLMTFYVNTPMLSIPDGADTYVFFFGHIVQHTVHDTVVFNNPPTP